MLLYLNSSSMVNVSELWMCKPNTDHFCLTSLKGKYNVLMCFWLFQNWCINYKSKNSISTSVSLIQIRMLLRWMMRATWKNYSMRIPTFLWHIHLIYLGQHGIHCCCFFLPLQNVLIAIISRMKIILYAINVNLTYDRLK